MALEIYALKCPVTLDVKYIGKANDTSKRLKSHLRDSKRRNTPVYSWIRGLETKGLIPIAEVLHITDEDNWKEDEIRIIAEYKAKGIKLLNLALGGDEPFL